MIRTLLRKTNKNQCGGLLSFYSQQGRVALLNRHLNNTAFTLIELLVVVALIGLISLFAIPSINNMFKLSLNSTAREMASVVKETYNSTIMTGQVHRLVFDLKENEYWVESGPKNMLLDTAETKEKEERHKRFASSKNTGKDSGTEVPKFKLETSILKKKKPLPRGVEFENVITEQSPEPLTEGLAYVHFFSHGLTEQTTIHLKDNSDHHFTLMISSLIGKTFMSERYLKPEEVEELITGGSR